MRKDAEDKTDDTIADMVTVECPTSVHPPDGGWGWMVVLGVSVMHFFLVGTARSLGVLYLVLRDRFADSAVKTAWVLALFNTVRSLIAPICGVFCDRFGCRTVALCGSLLLSVGFLTSAFATSLIQLYFTLGILAGTGGALVFTASYVIVSRYFVKKKGKAMALGTIGSGVGNIVLAPLINTLVSVYTFTGAMLVLSALMAHNFISSFLYRPLHKTDAPAITCESARGTSRDMMEEDNTNVGSEATMKEGSTAYFQEYRRLLCSARFLLYSLQMVCMQICIHVYLIFLPAFAVSRGASESRAAFAPSVFGFADMCGRLFFGVVFDLRAVRSWRTVLHGFLAGLFGLLALCTAFASDVVSIFAMAALVGVVESAVHSQRMTVVADLVISSQLSAAVSFTIFSQGVGSLIGPPIAGLLRDRTGNNASGLLFCGTSLIVSASMFLAYALVTRRCR